MRENFTAMLIRVVIDNVLSFGQQKEFHLLPSPRLRTLSSHIYTIGGIELLKLSAIYGANGAGKSNLVRAIAFLKELVLTERIPLAFKKTPFKFQEQPQNSLQTLAIEFVQEDVAFYYGIGIRNQIIVTEELYVSGLGKREDELIFERNTDADGRCSLQFSAAFERIPKNQTLKELLLEEFIKNDKPILQLIANRENEALQLAKKAFRWFKDSLVLIDPDVHASALPHQIDVDGQLAKFANQFIQGMSLGIQKIETLKIDAAQMIHNTGLPEKLVNALSEADNKMLGLRSGNKETVLVEENGTIWAKELQLQHLGGQAMLVDFDADEESDGTMRLLDFIPAFKGLTEMPKVYIIDEMERSLHPLLVKELVKKFSLDEQTKGQLIFTTHESNLLDQSLLRQDEIWFAEKDAQGCTDLYALSAFKEHKSIDIQKGYLSGRYGSIPFLGNLHDLNWHDYAHQK